MVTMDFGTNVLLHLQQPVEFLLSVREKQKKNYGRLLTLRYICPYPIVLGRKTRFISTWKIKVEVWQWNYVKNNNCY